MRISELTLKEFRNFENETIKFHPNFTVVIGDNGTGKTVVLKGLSVAIGGFINSLPINNQISFLKEISILDQRVWWDDDKKDYLKQSFFIPDATTEVRVNGTFKVKDDEEDKKYVLVRKFIDGSYTASFNNHQDSIQLYVKSLFEAYKNNEEVVFPVIAIFDVDRTNKPFKLPDSSLVSKNNIEKAYLKVKDSFIGYLYNWLSTYESNLNLKKRFEFSREAIYDAIKIGIPFVKEIFFNQTFDRPEFELVLDFSDGKPIERKLLSNCSDGIQAMVTLVAEIAFRAVLLNGRYGADAVKKSPGIVLIDELDLLLHPNWQRHVVHDLIAAFPQMQFVATTHSPFIVQSLETSMLWNLERVVDVDISKLGLAEVATAVMGVESAYSEKSEEIFQKIVNPQPSDELPSDPLARAFHVLTQSGK